ncbi:hypothetical protein B0I31_1338 [Saccharothrix carnea]|uniref:Vegetative cell wall protein gp1 n=1 Tax=Saccharothrix carnea TaxID=1280637 RepID=A0A2P8H9X8_SACCR|nr:hypothetical protein [Saccharothrix carnea]PSL43001.1 hypothetical protein B0I31_1338 [Saccharothrix carnea]
MTKFLEALAGKLAERWLSLLVLPGALCAVAALVAVNLGHRSSYGPSTVTRVLTRLVEPAPKTATLVLYLVVLLAAATGVGFAVQALGAAFTRLWLAEPRDPLSRWSTRRRQARWSRAQAAFEEALVAAGKARVRDQDDAAELRHEAERRNARRNRIALAPPRRPFWTGDRITAADHRVHEHYGLDLTTAWPRLWLLMPEPDRAEFTLARTAFGRAAALAGWAVAYLGLGAVCWPFALVGLVTAGAAWRRARTACDVLAELIESAVDLHGRTLAQALGLPCEGHLDRDTGRRITELLRKNA